MRVLLVDDESLIRMGFRYILGAAEVEAEHPAIEVVGEVGDGAAAVAFVRAHRPDVVLMDVSMPIMTGLEATEVIVAESESRVLAMTSLDAEDQLFRMLEAGATGYLLKDESPARIVDAVRRTARGDAVVSALSTAQLVRRAVAGEGGAGRRVAIDRLGVLTERERDVAQRVASGATNQEIGAALHIAAGTVKSHLEQVFVKLGVRNRVQVGVILERAGLGPLDV